MRRSHIERQRGRQPSVGGEGHRLEDDAEHQRRREIGVLRPEFPSRRSAARSRRAPHRRASASPAASLLNWSCCTKSRNRKSERVLVVRVTEPANHRGELSASRRLGACQRLAAARRTARSAARRLPTRVRFSRRSGGRSPLLRCRRPGRHPGRVVGVDAAVDEKLDRGPFDAFPGVGEAVSWHSK